MSRGVLYLLWGDECDALHARSLASLKRVHPELPVEVVRLPNNSTYLDKVAMYDRSPFDVTAYLDADTVIFGNLDFAYRMAERHGVACCINECPWARRYKGLADRNDITEYNAGVVFFDKIRSRPLFDAWKECCYTIDSSSLFNTEKGTLRQRCNDQAGMAKAFDDTGYLPYVLPMNWNYRPFWQRSFMGNIKIWHDYADPPQRIVDFSTKAETNVLLDTVYLMDGPEEDKPPEPEGKRINVACAMSVPRLGFQDNFFCISEGLTPLGIKPVHYDGVFWGQCLERVMSEQLNADWILSLDYDSVFTRKDVEKLLSLAARSDFADAIAAVQLRRKTSELMIGIKKEAGKLDPVLNVDALTTDLLQVDVAHFGMTMFRTAALKRMVHPWFLNVPDDTGKWGDGKQDEDIYFWRKWKATGNSLYLANHVVTGHIESMIAWPDDNMDVVYQHPCDFWPEGKPNNVWK